MGKLLIRNVKHALAAGLGLALLLAVACGAPAAPSGTAPPAAVSEPQTTAPAASAPHQPVATVAPAPQSQISRRPCNRTGRANRRLPS